MPQTLTPPELPMRQLAHLFYFGYIHDKHVISEEDIDVFTAMKHVVKDKDNNNYLTLTGKLYAASLARAGDFDQFELNT